MRQSAWSGKSTSRRYRSGNSIIISPSINPSKFAYRIPVLLTYLRLVLAPVLFLSATNGWGGVMFAAIVVAGFGSDVLDGVIARRLGVSTPEFRALDSQVDTVFYAAAALSVWWVHPDVVRRIAIPASVVIVLEVTRYVLEKIKFGRQAAYHAWSAKVWGVSLVIALITLMTFGVENPFTPIAVWLGIIADIEGLATTLILPAWKSDVKSFAHALKVRRALESGEHQAA